MDLKKKVKFYDDALWMCWSQSFNSYVLTIIYLTFLRGGGQRLWTFQ